ncbi:MAG: choice-of-anchor A family protein [bacterium]
MISQCNRFLSIFVLLFLIGFVNIGAVTDSIATKNAEEHPLSYYQSAITYGANSAIAKVLATDKGANVTFTNPYNGTTFSNVFAGTFNAEVNNQPNIKLFCIDILHHLSFWTVSQPNTYIDAGNTPSQITYVLNNYYPYKSLPYTGSLSEKNEACAVQIAVWHFSDGVNANTVTNSAIKNRALQIIADADANAGNITPVATLIITPASQELYTGQAASLRVYAYDERGNVSPNVSVNLSAVNGTLSSVSGVTNAAGYFAFTLNQGSVNTATVTASALVVLPQGTKYVNSINADGYQKLVLATPVMATRLFSATVKWLAKTDLRLSKTVNNNNPSNGDVITFTVTVTNDGPTPATGVEVMDLIDNGFEIQSATPTQGSYIQTTGKWLVGALANGASASLVISVKVNSDAMFTSQLSFGDADDFNVFVFEDINQPSSDTEGKMAAGRDIFLANYSVGDKLQNSNGTEDVLIAGRNLTYLTGAVFGGNVVYGSQSNLPVDYVSVEGEVRQDSVIDFAGARSYLLDLSATIAGYSANGKDTMIWSSLYLDGTHPLINIFNVSGSDVNNSTEIFVNVPSGSTALINISGDSVNVDGGLVVSGADKYSALFNLYEATKLVIQNIDIQGTVFAPKADVNYVDGQLNGQFIAKSVYGKGQFNIAKFIGNIPGTTTLENIAEVTRANQLDPDSQPGNGITTEDDYAAVAIVVNPNLSVGSGSVNVNWEYAGSFSSDEIVWVITRDKDGFLLTGTWGGKIYRSIDDGASWALLNGSMNVGYIWSIIVNNSNIFAATEKGVYYSSNNGTTWSLYSLANKDVRTLLVTNNNTVVYAGIWGEGVFKSTDLGLTWTAKNEGLTFKAINSLAENGSGEMFAGTFGGGIYKSSDNAENWTKLNVGYDHVWSIGINSSDEIFAATYGNGMYYSGDGGTTFSKQAGVSAPYIYSVTIDGGNVFASAWNGGIYLYQNATESGWAQLGMVGFGVSSVFIDRGVLYAGTSDGRLYKNTTPFVGVEDNISTLSYSFNLEQNYPNPFNPSTIIKYSIAEASNVKLTIYDILGREVVTLINSEARPGAYQLIWNATDKFGKKVSSGIYFYSLEAGKFNKTNKMLLMK